MSSAPLPSSWASLASRRLVEGEMGRAAVPVGSELERGPGRDQTSETAEESGTPG